MILDTPQPRDFERYGIDYLNLGWSSATKLILEYVEADIYAGDDIPDLKSDFWEAAEREVGTACFHHVRDR